VRGPSASPADGEGSALCRLWSDDAALRWLEGEDGTLT
jgi:hypothetical protein